MPENDLPGALLDSGLIQFGRFVAKQGEARPLHFGLEMLASYPEILRQVARAIGDSLTAAGEPHVERLVCTPDAVALGVGVSLHTGIPLVYSRGRGEVPSHDLTGAYDVGHPTALLTNVNDAPEPLRQFEARAASVGLVIMQRRAVVGCAPGVRALLQLDSLITLLEGQGRLPRGQADAVRAWLADLPNGA